MVFRNKKDQKAKQTPSKVGSKFSADAGDDDQQVVKTPNVKNIKQKQVGSDKKVSFQVSNKVTPAGKKTPKGENFQVKMQPTPGKRSLKQFSGISKNTQKTNGKVKKNIKSESDDDDDDEDEDLDMLLGNDEDEEMDDDESEADEQDDEKAEDESEADEEDDDEMDEEESEADEEEENKIQITHKQMKTTQTSKNIKNNKKLVKEETKTPSKNTQSSGKNAAKGQMQKSVLKLKSAAEDDSDDDDEEEEEDESDEELDEDESEESKIKITQNQVKAALTSKKIGNEQLVKGETKTPSKNTQSPAKNTAKAQIQKSVLKPKSEDDSEEDEEDDSEEDDDDDDDEEDEDESEEDEDEESKEKGGTKKEFEIQTQPAKSEKATKDARVDTLFVGGLGGVTPEEIKALSEDIVDVTFPRRLQGKPLVYAFLKFESEEKAMENYEILKTKKLNGKGFKVDYAKPRHSDVLGDMNVQKEHDKRRLFVSGLKTNVTIAELAQFFPSAQTVSIFAHDKDKTATIYYKSSDDAAKDLETAKSGEINGDVLNVSYGLVSRQEKRPFENSPGENTFGNRGKRGRYSGNRGQRGSNSPGRGQRGNSYSRRGQGGWNTGNRGQRGGFNTNKGAFKFTKTEDNDEMEE